MSKNTIGQRGFTLIELMIVTVIVGILAGIAIPHYFDLKDKTSWMAARENLDIIRAALATYVTQDGINDYPQGPLDFAGMKIALAGANLPDSEEAAQLRTGTFHYTSIGGFAFTFSANCANRRSDLLTASPAGVRPYQYEDY